MRAKVCSTCAKPTCGQIELVLLVSLSLRHTLVNWRRRASVGALSRKALGWGGGPEAFLDPGGSPISAVAFWRTGAARFPRTAAGFDVIWCLINLREYVSWDDEDHCRSQPRQGILRATLASGGYPGSSPGSERTACLVHHDRRGTCRKERPWCGAA